MSDVARRGLDVIAGVRDLPQHETRRLLLTATGWSSEQLYAGRKLTDDQRERLDAMIARRRRGEPLQHIEGTCDFGPLALRCDGRALIPRPETEQLWELAVAQFVEPPGIVVDVGTGSGCLALACKHQWPSAVVYATDTSQAALTLAAENVALTGLDVTLLLGDLLSALPAALTGAVDLIISNPPYLSKGELATLDTEVREHEPIEALVSGNDGLEVLDRLASDATQWLRRGGVIACEISEFRAEESGALFARYGAEVLPDLTGRARFVVGRAP